MLPVFERRPRPKKPHRRTNRDSAIKIAQKIYRDRWLDVIGDQREEVAKIGDLMRANNRLIFANSEFARVFILHYVSASDMHIIRVSPITNATQSRECELANTNKCYRYAPSIQLA